MIGRGHVIAAIAPPAERELREQFTAKLDHLDAELFEKTLQMLKGLPELGVLLQVERELPHLIRQVYGDHGSLFKEIDIEQWQKAEARLREALREFSQAAKATYQWRLFAQDAMEGLRLIDLTREMFDVVVMNPPFGQATKSLNEYYKFNYPETSSEELAATFFSRSVTLLRNGGLIGEISSRTLFFLYSLKEWRRNILFTKAPLRVFADIGAGELDDAVNETAIYIAQKGASTKEPCHFGMFHRELDKSLALKNFANFKYSENIYERPFLDFEILNDLPICYWVSSSFLKHLQNLEIFGAQIAKVQMGLAPRDEFRYSRLWWEVRPEQVGPDKKWVGYTKGGELSPYFSDVDLLLNAKDRLREIKADLNQKYPYMNGNLDWVLHPENNYFNDGLTFGQRTTFLRVSILPAGCYFSVAGKAIFGGSQNNKSLLQSLNTPSAQYLISIRREFLEINPQFQEGSVSRMPWPNLDQSTQDRLGELGMQNAEQVSKIFAFDETTHSFNGVMKADAYLEAVRDAKQIISENEAEADSILSELIGLSDTDKSFINHEILPKWHGRSVANWYKYTESVDEISFFIGVMFGRWDIRFATGSRQLMPFSNPFLPLQACSQGMLLNEFNFPVCSFDCLINYPVKIAISGILVDDDRHQEDFIEKIQAAFQVIVEGQTEYFEKNACDKVGVKSLREYIFSPSGFFEDHLKRYSKSGRKAPIYWPLATTSGSYTLWVYYPRLSSQTFYIAINDFVEPKIKQVSDDVVALRNKGIARSRDDEKKFEIFQNFEQELIELRDTLLKIAQKYRPNHDDGVQITAAPLWSLFRHKPWQKILKDTWEKLEKGDFDWAHLAMNYWLDRVREKCKIDKSLAIAHGLESLYVEPEAKPKKTRGKKVQEG